ncbi:MAG TPA: hypothetical protein VFR20_03220 [Burkholderiaceae bacterium]|nr:hypothetical protein [Burkholderiaceae bacterium]
MSRVSAAVLAASLFTIPVALLPLPAAAAVSVGISVNVSPPALPVYEQPAIPGPGYIWTPGYWAWSNLGYYYWVPGVWVLPPIVGVLWTPGWWGWSDGFYRWHPGYWGPRVGFYGGINYGFGYFGTGYVGGYWRGRDFYYNRAVNHINVTNIRNVYVNKTVINNVHINRTSYNGGRGGIVMRPTAAQRSYGNQHHYAPTSFQARQREMSERDRGQRFDMNRGRPEAPARQYMAHPESRPNPGQPRQAGRVQPQQAGRPEQRLQQERRIEQRPARPEQSPRVNQPRPPVSQERAVTQRRNEYRNTPPQRPPRQNESQQRRQNNAERPHQDRRGGGRPERREGDH